MKLHGREVKHRGQRAKQMKTTGLASTMMQAMMMIATMPTRKMERPNLMGTRLPEKQERRRSNQALELR